MNKIIQDSRMKEALDLLLEGDIDISDALGEGGLIKRLTKAVLERALAVEMDNHLGYDRYDRSDFNLSQV
jgi:transposase-like protein